MTNPISVAQWDQLPDRTPTHALVAGVDLVVVRFDDAVSVMYGRCLHRGALMADGFVRGDDLICGVHDWDYRLETGVSAYNNKEALPKFRAWVEDGQVWVDADEIKAWAADHPQPFDRDAYLGVYQDTHPDPAEDTNRYIQTLAKQGIAGWGTMVRSQRWGSPESGCRPGMMCRSLPPSYTDSLCSKMNLWTPAW